MLKHSFWGMDPPISHKRKWALAMAIAIAGLVGLPSSLLAQDCDSVHEVISFNAADGLLPDEVSMPWVAGCGSSQWIDGEITGNLLEVLDDSNPSTDPPNGLRSGYCQYDIFDCSSQHGVFEVVGRAEPGANSSPPHNIDIVWFSGFLDLDKSLILAFTEDAVGFIKSNPVDWLSNGVAQAKYDLDTTDGLHTYRVEKHGQSEALLFVDDQLKITWDYADLSIANGPNKAVLSATSSPGTSEFSIKSFQYRVGSTSFDFDPSACSADLDGDSVVGTTDLLSLLASWGPCENCNADFNNDGAVGTSDLLFMLSLWGPLDENCSGGVSEGSIVVTGDACNPDIPLSAYQVLDLGNNHFDIYLNELYAPFSNTYFELHPNSAGINIDHLFINVEGPPAGSPVVVRVLPACNDPDLKFDTVQNILETADGEHLLNWVDVDGDVGTVIVEAIGVILLGGDVIGDIIATTPNNSARGITKISAGGSIFGDIRAPLGKIAFISAQGDIGTMESPIAIEAKHLFSNITQAQSLHANINGHVNGGMAAISMIYVDQFMGSLDVRTMSSQPSGGVFHFAVKLDAPITFTEGYTGPNRRIEMPVGGLTTQIILNAENNPDAIWDAPIKIGFDEDPEQIILTGPGYTNTAESLGGGSVGLAPFDLHDESCIPANGATILLTCAEPDLQVKLRHYGPITLNANAPLIIERRIAGSADPFVEIPSTDFVYFIDPSDANSLLVSGALDAEGFLADYEYRFSSTINLMCDQVDANPPVNWDSLDYRITVLPGCPGAKDGRSNGAGLPKSKFRPFKRSSRRR